MSARGRRRVLGGVAGALLLIGVGLTPPAQVTDAAFTDREYSTATFRAFTVPAPTITSCTAVNNGLGIFQSVTLVWTSTYPATGVSLTLTQGSTTATVPAANITTTGPAAGGVYTHTAVLTQGLLASLLTNLLGSTTTMTARNLLVGTTWVSAGATRQLAVGALGVGSSCT